MSQGAAGSPELERFRAAVRARLGLHVDDARTSVLEEALAARVAAHRGNSAQYLQLLSDPACPSSELHALAELLTVTETYFFRNIEQLDAFAACALPERAAETGIGGHIRVLSVGCASGDEAYSLAITAREVAPILAAALSIRGVDMNPAMLAKARAATYAPWALRSTSDERRRRWFRQEGTRVVLDDSIRSAVTFHEGNLAADHSDLWRAESYDIVFCRNVLMYFGPDEARAAVERIERSLVPGGFLFLGHAETLRGLSNAFHLHHTHDTFYYQRKAGAYEATDPRATNVAPIDWSVPPASIDTSWVDAIQRATERIDALVKTGSHMAVPTVEKDPPGLSTALALIEREQFAEGERECTLLMQADGPTAGAHYLLALCREGSGDSPGARAHDEAAIAIDPTFAMARLHLGLLERRTGNHDAARRLLESAMSALRNEEPSRLRLFGGGFGSEGLIALCRSALAAFDGRGET